MIIDAETIEAGATLRADVCVLGAGPAGLSIAQELNALGLSVVVLEAGGVPYDRHDRRMWPHSFVDHIKGSQALTRGYSDGEPYFPLRMSRARGIGGSTNALKAHGLRARPLDPFDFESRSGASWPIDYEEVDQYVARAMTWCGLDGDLHPGVWEASPAIPGDQRLERLTILDGPRDAFSGIAYDEATTSAVRMLTYAVAVDLKLRGGTFDRVLCLTSGRRPFAVDADRCVVATGGIDNARILLASSEVLAAMGGSAENVGRYFMEHPHYAAGYILPSSPDAVEQINSLLQAPDGAETVVALHDDLVRENGLFRSVFELAPVYREAVDPGVRAAGSLMRIVPFGPFKGRGRADQIAAALRGSRSLVKATRARLAPSREKDAFALLTMSEQPSVASSRVRLSDRRDTSGLPLPILHWEVADEEFVSMRRTLRVVGDIVESNGLGEVRSIWDQGVTRPPVVHGGWHHMGTTRMTEDPNVGVVDRDCRVHGVEGLYVAGSSVFPTGGFVNPTLTLVALGLRLADHLGRT
jgi:choline dehydrogenase-like flavoprotein